MYEDDDYVDEDYIDAELYRAEEEARAGTYWARYFKLVEEQTEPDPEAELFARYEQELSLPDHYGNRAYTHWFVEVAL